MKSEILEFHLHIAKGILKKDGYLTPVFVFFKQDKVIRILPVVLVNSLDTPAEVDKKNNFFAVGAFAKIFSADSVIIIMDAAMRKVIPGEPDDITTTPCTYPRSMRIEAIMATLFTFPDGDIEFLYAPYKGGKEVGEPVEFLPLPEGKIEGFEFGFKDTILAGYHV